MKRRKTDNVVPALPKDVWKFCIIPRCDVRSRIQISRCSKSLYQAAEDFRADLKRYADCLTRRQRCILAAKLGNLQFIFYFLNLYGSFGYATQICYKCVKYGHIDVIKKLIKSRPIDFPERNCRGWICRGVAAFGDLDRLRSMLTKWTIQIWCLEDCIAKAAKYGHIRIIEYLKSARPSIPLTQVIYYAIKGNQLAVVKWRVANGAVVTGHDVYYALTLGHIEIANFLRIRLRDAA